MVTQARLEWELVADWLEGAGLLAEGWSLCRDEAGNMRVIGMISAQRPLPGPVEAVIDMVFHGPLGQMALHHREYLRMVDTWSFHLDFPSDAFAARPTTARVAIIRKGGG